jgi:hypothetical protein
LVVFFNRLIRGKLFRAMQYDEVPFLQRFPARSGNAPASAPRSACRTPRSVINPLTSRAGVTSNA